MDAGMACTWEGIVQAQRAGEAVCIGCEVMCILYVGIYFEISIGERRKIIF